VGAVVRDKVPHTFMFKTGSGKIGLLQITGFAENPRGVKIRYKLVQNPAPAALPLGYEVGKGPPIPSGYEAGKAPPIPLAYRPAQATAPKSSEHTESNPSGETRKIIDYCNPSNEPAEGLKPIPPEALRSMEEYREPFKRPHGRTLNSPRCGR
jgi:hypothetical protein